MMIKIRPIVAVLFVLLFIIPLSFPAFATATPAPTGGGGHSSGGGGGRRGWLDTFAPGFVDDGSNLPVGDTASGAYLSLDHVDADGNYWFLVNCLNFTPINNWPTTFIVENSSNINTLIWSGSVNYGDSSNCLYASLNLNSSLSTIKSPVLGNYRVIIKFYDIHVSGSDIRKFSFNSLSDYVDFTHITSFTKSFPVQSFAKDSLLSFTDSIPFSIYASRTVQWTLKCKILLKCSPSLTYTSSVNKIGSITGDVVVIGDNNKVTKYDNCTFVDEVNKKYYCPTTNIWTTYNSYSYDYSNFTYNFVTDSGNTTINYGDEYISYSETVNNVTNVYNYYYSAPGTGGGTGGDSGGSSGGTNWLSWLKDRLQTALGSILDAFFEWLAAVVKDVLTAIWEFFKGLWTFLSGFLDGFAERVKQFFGYMSSTNGGFFDFSGVTYNYGKVISSPGVTS